MNTIKRFAPRAISLAAVWGGCWGMAHWPGWAVLPTLCTALCVILWCYGTEVFK